MKWYEWAVVVLCFAPYAIVVAASVALLIQIEKDEQTEPDP